MAEIPVYVQRPCKPPGIQVGSAPDYIEPENVAQLVGVPLGCFIDGKIMTSKKEGLPPRRWALVADVTFRAGRRLR